MTSAATVLRPDSAEPLERQAQRVSSFKLKRVVEQSIMSHAMELDRKLEVRIVLKKNARPDKVCTWAEHAGLRITKRLAKSLHAEGTVDQLQKAFNVKIVYTDASKQYFGTTAPMADSDDVHCVLGLDNHPSANPKVLSSPFAVSG